MNELQKPTHELRAELDSVKRSVESAFTALAALEDSVAKLAAVSKPSVEETVARVEMLREGQRSAVDEVRARGLGTGLRKALDEHTDLAREEEHIVHTIKERCGGGPDPDVKSALERYRELKRQQLSLLTSETGKLEAQGLTEQLARYRDLADQQEEIIRRVLGDS